MVGYHNERRARIGLGSWEPHADSTPVADHIRALRRRYSLLRIASDAGLSVSTVQEILKGQKTIRRTTYDALMGVQ
jgi:AraC-like DNA-binding protein